MKLYDELKTEMDVIRQHMIEAKKNKLAKALKGIKGLHKESEFSTEILKSSSTEKRNKQ
jgi:hypothetical protein